MYQTVIEQLRTAYNHKVDERAHKPPEPWKIEERAHFLQTLQAEGKQTLLEIGAGTGQDSLFFQEKGFTVTCTDLSPEMIKHCRAQGLNAYMMDFAQLAFPPESFDAVYARNCLLHVPKTDFPGILQQIRALLRPGGLFFLGQYGGVDQEGVWAGDHYEPKRFFARYLDDQIKALVTPVFDLLYFKAVPLDDDSAGHFQSMILRK
ncbi:MAG: class I SAM-dependent methyltransferase [Caldilineaceae bacterium]